MTRRPVSFRPVTCALAALTLSTISTSAQPPATAPEAGVIKNLRWRSIGPANQAGRIAVVVGVPGDRSTYYVGAAAGGIVKTTNGGVTFAHIFDDQPFASIGDIAIAPSDHNVIYVGTGEGNPRNSASIGNGVYKSVDAGRTWTYLGLDGTDKIARLRVDPRDPDIVYVCALGHTWGPNEERGVYKTTDGGTAWKKILYKDQLTGCSDIDTDPSNSSIVYAGMYTHRRYPYYFTSGAGETALYKSTDGGATWTRLSGPGNTRGLPKKDMDRIGISVSRSSPDVVYVVSETKDEGELWRTDDGGVTWRTVNRDPNINFRPFYYSDIRVDPQNPNRIFSLSGSLNLSEDGGRTFQRIANDVHGDHQAMWIDPTDPKYVLSGSDGGWQVSYDGGRNFEIVNTVAFSQFYHLNYDMRTPYYICGGLQDNGHWCGPSRTASTQGIRKSDWYTISGGDGFFAVPDLERPHLVYSAAQGGQIVITDTRSGEQRSIHPYPYRVGSAGDSLAHHKYRFNWNPPIVLDPADPKTVYYGGNVVFKTTNFGQSWEVISPDLTTNDKAKQRSSGGPIVTDNTAAEFHSTLLSIAPSPRDRNVIWTGSDDGLVQVTRDGGKTWTNVFKSPPGLAPNAWISTVEASPHDAGTAFVAASHWQDNDYAPYIYKTSDFGQTWRRISGNLPARGWVHVVREDPKVRNLLYAGTEFGVFASWDGGTRWSSIRNGLPAAPVRDLLVHTRDNDLIIATHGRGLYVLDDITPLQKAGEAIATADAHLYDIRPAVRWMMWSSDGNLGQKHYVGQNPPHGALVHYFLKSAPKDSAEIEVADASGKVIRRLRRAPSAEGMNRAAWDLRHDGPRTPATEQSSGAGGGGGGGGGGFGQFAGQGPWVVPGDYTLTLKVAGKSISKPVRVDADPRVQVAPQDYLAQLEAALAMRDLSSRVAGLIDRTDDVIKQLTALTETLKRGGGAAAVTTATAANPGAGNGAARGAAHPALTEAEAALARLKSFRSDVLARPIAGLGYRQYPRLREEVQTLSRMISNSMSRPTDPQKLRMGELQEETTKAASELNSIFTGPIAKVNQLMSGSPHIIVAGTPVM